MNTTSSTSSTSSTAGTQARSTGGETIEDVLLDELTDLLDAEKQLVTALPKVAEAVSSDELREAINSHLEETKAQQKRLEKALEKLGKPARNRSSGGMKSLVAECEGVIALKCPETVKDAALIGAAQRIEHYEIAGYGCARAFAEMAGQREIVELLDETLEEEQEADHRLTEIAMSTVNADAAADQDDDDNGDHELPGADSSQSKRRKGKHARRR